MQKPRKAFCLSAILLMALSACTVSPEQAQTNRDARLADQFPNPADRQGMFIVFQDGLDKFVVEYLPQEISEATAVSRIAQLCQNVGQGTSVELEERLPKLTQNSILANGQSVPVRAVRVACA